jgi:hypothetical protein
MNGVVVINLVWTVKGLYILLLLFSLVVNVGGTCGLHHKKNLTTTTFIR